MSARGKPSPQSPVAIARELGLPIPGGPLEWRDLADAAFRAYWTRNVRNVRWTPRRVRVITVHAEKEAA
jgi:hypothetical protein